MSDDPLQVVRVINGTPFPQTKTLSVAVETPDGRASIIVGPEALVALGVTCLHAATNAPLAADAAIPVLGVRHQARPDGSQTISFEVPGARFSLILEPKGAEALRDMLTYAIGASAPQGSVPPEQRN